MHEQKNDSFKAYWIRELDCKIRINFQFQFAENKCWWFHEQTFKKSTLLEFGLEQNTISIDFNYDGNMVIKCASH